MARQISDSEMEGIRARTRAADLEEPRAAAAWFDAEGQRLGVELRSGVVLMIPVRLLQGLAGGSPDAITEVEITPSGSGLHWELLDADLSVADLAVGRYGNGPWMSLLARQMGRRGGASRSNAKSAAARANGLKGGRPRRQPAPTGTTK